MYNDQAIFTQEVNKVQAKFDIMRDLFDLKIQAEQDMLYLLSEAKKESEQFKGRFFLMNYRKVYNYIIENKNELNNEFLLQLLEHLKQIKTCNENLIVLIDSYITLFNDLRDVDMNNYIKE
jgi:hypothetical protein